MSNMTPFEIRLELLKMARDMLYDDYQAQKDRLQQDWNVKCDTAKAKGEVPPEFPPIPTIPSESDIIAKASTLNGFVSNFTPHAEPAAKVLSKKNS